MQAQVRLGSSEDEIRADYANNRYHLQAGETKDGTYYIGITTERARVVYFFGEDRVCYVVAVSPRTKADLNFYVARYNRLYVPLSPTKWRMYSHEGIAEAELVLSADGSSFFAWRYIDEDK